MVEWKGPSPPQVRCQVWQAVVRECSTDVSGKRFELGCEERYAQRDHTQCGVAAALSHQALGAVVLPRCQCGPRGPVRARSPSEGLMWQAPMMQPEWVAALVGKATYQESLLKQRNAPFKPRDGQGGEEDSNDNKE